MQTIMTVLGGVAVYLAGVGTGWWIVRRRRTPLRVNLHLDTREVQAMARRQIAHVLENVSKEIVAGRRL